MALSKSKKNEKVKQLASELEHSTSAIIGTFTGLTAAKDFDLRKTIRAAGGSYHVVKNKLAAKSAQGTKVEKALQGLKGVSSVAYTSGDPVALAKALSNWVKDNAEFTFKLGIVDGKVINVQEIQSLATLPGKEELFSKLLFLINSPATASGDGHQRHRPQSGRGGEPGGRAEQARWRCWRSSRGEGRGSCGGSCARAQGRSDRSSRARRGVGRPASSPRAQRSRRTRRPRRLAKRPRRSPLRDNKFRRNSFRVRWSGRNGNLKGAAAT